MPHTLSAAYAALRREKDRVWAERQRELAEATGDADLIVATEKMIERRIGGKDQHAGD
jgi:hypothetical protein